LKLEQLIIEIPAVLIVPGIKGDYMKRLLFAVSLSVIIAILLAIGSTFA